MRRAMSRPGRRTGQENEPRNIAIARAPRKTRPRRILTIRCPSFRAAPPARRRAWARSRRRRRRRRRRPRAGARLARIGRQRQRQRLDRHEAEVDAVAERLDLVVLVGIDDDLGARAARPRGSKVRRTGWSMRVVTGSRVTTQVCTTVAPSVAVELPAAAGQRRQPAGEAQLAHRLRAEQPRQRLGLRRGRARCRSRTRRGRGAGAARSRGRIRDCRGRGG